MNKHKWTNIIWSIWNGALLMFFQKLIKFSWFMLFKILIQTKLLSTTQKSIRRSFFWRSWKFVFILINSKIYGSSHLLSEIFKRVAWHWIIYCNQLICRSFHRTSRNLLFLRTLYCWCGRSWSCSRRSCSCGSRCGRSCCACACCRRIWNRGAYTTQIGILEHK